MSFIKYARSVSADMADYADFVAARPLTFEGPDPLQHSSENHIPLHTLARALVEIDRVDVSFCCEFIKFVLEQWRRRLKGLPPYTDRGYRLYVYADSFAPTLSAVAETDIGFPYRGNFTFVEHYRSIMEIYVEPQWLDGGEWHERVTSDAIVAAVDRQAGSIGKKTADRLRIGVGELRRLISQMHIGSRVNKIRKRHGRSPADFPRLDEEFTGPFFERRLKAHYR